MTRSVLHGTTFQELVARSDPRPAGSGPLDASAHSGNRMSGQLFAEGTFKRLDDFDHRTPRPRGLRRTVSPPRVRLVHGNIIPCDRLSIVRFLSHRLRQNAIGIPELSGTSNIDACERLRNRRRRIAGQNGLPDHMHNDPWIVQLLQRSVECRGPLQTCRSSGREHRDHLHLIGRGTIEPLNERTELRGRRERLDHRLTSRRRARPAAARPRRHTADGQSEIANRHPANQFART